jgi:hypothetical protein
MIEHGNDVTTRLMNREDNGALVVTGQGYKTFHDIERVVCIETCQKLVFDRACPKSTLTAGRLVQEQNGWAGDKFTSNGYTSFLSTGDRSSALSKNK